MGKPKKLLMLYVKILILKHMFYSSVQVNDVSFKIGSVICTGYDMRNSHLLFNKITHVCVNNELNETQFITNSFNTLYFDLSFTMPCCGINM